MNGTQAGLSGGGQPRILCDEMLEGLARWLRAAGHDARTAPDGTADADLLALAATQLLCCPGCRRLFRDGSHVRRMRAQLARANG